MIDLEAIRERNEVADVACLRDGSCGFRCAHVKADIDALIAEVERFEFLEDRYAEAVSQRVGLLQEVGLLRDRIRELCKREELLEHQRDT